MAMRASIQAGSQDGGDVESDAVPQSKEELEAQEKLVANLQAEIDGLAEQAVPLQVRESDLRKWEFDAWQEVRAIKAHLMDGTKAEVLDYLRWERKTRQKEADELHKGIRKPQSVELKCLP